MTASGARDTPGAAGDTVERTTAQGWCVGTGTGRGSHEAEDDPCFGTQASPDAWRWNALVRAPAVASMLLLTLMQSGISPQGQIGSQGLSGAAQSLVEAAGSALLSAPRVDFRRRRDRARRPPPAKRRCRSTFESPAARAAKRLADASPADRSRVQAALSAAGPRAAALVLEAFAAGHSADEVVRFAHLIPNRKRAVASHAPELDRSVRARLGEVPGLSGEADRRHGVRVDVDPDGARDGRSAVRPLPDDSDGTEPEAESAPRFQARLAVEEHRIHDATNRFWPQRLGSTPSGVSPAEPARRGAGHAVRATISHPRPAARP